MQPPNNFLAQSELARVTDPSTPLFASPSEYRAAMTRFLMSGLKALGYPQALQRLEEESGFVFPRIFDSGFHELLERGETQEALNRLDATAASRSLAAQQKTFIHFEILKLAYFRLLLAQKTMEALTMFRTSLKGFGQLFEKDKRMLSQLYLVKGRTELVATIGFDPEDSAQLANHLKRIEYLVLTNQSHTEGFEDPFELMCRNNLAYQLLTCRYHRPAEISMAPADQDDPSPPPTAPVPNNNLSLNGLLLGVVHKCPTPPVPLSPFQRLEEVKDEIWKLKFDRSGTYLLATTRNRFVHCWRLQEGKFGHIWKTQLEAKEDINDYSVSEHRSRVCVATQNSSVVILDLGTGARMPSISKAHTDIVTSIYCFASGEEMLTAGVDGFLILWNGNNEKTREVKTRRVAGMAVAPSEAFLLLLHSNSLLMDRVDLDTHRITSNLVREKHSIVSHQIDPSSAYLLVNTSFELPELHLWRLSDGALLNAFTGHTQRQCSIGCSFLSDNLICCGSDSGVLNIWHVHDPTPLATEKRHELSLNAIAVARPETALPFPHPPEGAPASQSTALFLATGSDDGHIIISR